MRDAKIDELNKFIGGFTALAYLSEQLMDRRQFSALETVLLDAGKATVEAVQLIRNMEKKDG